jgi:hypothetical protein
VTKKTKVFMPMVVYTGTRKKLWALHATCQKEDETGLHFPGLFLCLLPRQHSSSSSPHKKNTMTDERSDQEGRKKNPEEKWMHDSGE